MTQLIQMKTVDIINTDFQSILEGSTQYIELSQKIDTAITESENIVVITENDVATASHYLKSFRNLAKDLESHRKEITDPLDSKKKEIMNVFKGIISRFEKEESRLNSEILTFKRKRDEENRKREIEERKKREDEALQAAIAAGVDEPDIVAEVVHKEVKISQLNSAGVQTRKYKKWEITDIVSFVRNIPDDMIERLITVDNVAMNSYRGQFDVEAKSTIPGLKFYFEEKV